MTNEEQYVVEKILDKRTRRGVVQYLIKWTGCDESENTWEPERNLKCDALLKQFHQEVGPQSNKRGRRSTKSLPSDNEQVIDSPGPVVKVEKKPTRKASKKSLEAPPEQQVEADGTEAVIKPEKAVEENPQRDEFSQQSAQGKEAQPKKRGKRWTKSLPSESEQAIDPRGQNASVEKTDDKETKQANEPKRRSGQAVGGHSKAVKKPVEGNLKSDELPQSSQEQETKPKKRGRPRSTSLPLDSEQAIDKHQVPLVKINQKDDDECAELDGKVEIENVEKKRKITPKKKLAKKSVQEQTDGNSNDGNGFARGYSVENLVGITQEEDQFLFLVKWHQTDEMEMVPSAEVRKFVPEMMIDFYESRITWKQKSPNANNQNAK